MGHSKILKETQKKIDDCSVRRQDIANATELAARKICTAKFHLKNLEKEFPRIAAQKLLGDIDPTVLDNHLTDMEQYKKEIAIHEAALEGLNDFGDEALKESRQLQDTLRKQEAWAKYEDLKKQLLKRYSWQRLDEALRTLKRARQILPL